MLKATKRRECPGPPRPLIAATARFDFSAYKDEEVDLELAAEIQGCSVELHLSNRMAERRCSREAELPARALGPVGARFDPVVNLAITRGGAPLAIKVAEGQLRFGTSPPIVLTNAPFVGNLMLTLGHSLGEAEFDGTDVSSLLISLACGASMHAVRFDESLDYFRALTETPGLGSVPSKERALLHGNRCLPRQLVEAFAAQLEADPALPSLRISSDTVELLARLTKLLGFASCSVATDRMEKTAELIAFGPVRLEFARPDGSTLHHSKLSYGQKRLLAFLFYVGVNEQLVLADEPANGLHPRWIEACLEELGDRQVFLASQNPLLLDSLTFESAEEAQASFIQCPRRLDEKGESLSWENLSAQDSQDFFSGYQAGIQQVSAILESRGLW